MVAVIFAGLEKISLVGWSDGGITALVVAVMYPHLVDKLVVFGSNAYVTQVDVENCESEYILQLVLLCICQYRYVFVMYLLCICFVLLCICYVLFWYVSETPPAADKPWRSLS